MIRGWNSHGDKIMIQLEPIYKRKVWGGRKLNSIYGRVLPGGSHDSIGESWDLVDRTNDQSVVANGIYKGLTLHDLWSDHKNDIFGHDAPNTYRFPIICKILDAQKNLSIQVHPPAGIAQKMGMEPKSEFWYSAQADPYSLWYGGITDNVTPTQFRNEVINNNVLSLIMPHTIMQGNSWFLPSGTVHGLGANQIIFEIQENSDTTFRIYDWERTDRNLHIAEAIDCIDFITPNHPKILIRDDHNCLIDNDIFRIEEHHIHHNTKLELPYYKFIIVAVVSGKIECNDVTFNAGSYFMLPANNNNKFIYPINDPATILSIAWPTK